jgi:hypothetical protein
MDLWSIDQTKASFLGLTTHWIEVKKNKWNLCSQVIAFCGVSGAHSGVNLGRYIVGLCERVGIVSGQSTKVCLIIFHLQWLLLPTWESTTISEECAGARCNNRGARLLARSALCDLFGEKYNLVKRGT